MDWNFDFWLLGAFCFSRKFLIKFYRQILSYFSSWVLGFPLQIDFLGLFNASFLQISASLFASDSIPPGICSCLFLPEAVCPEFPCQLTARCYGWLVELAESLYVLNSLKSTPVITNFDGPIWRILGCIWFSLMSAGRGIEEGTPWDESESESYYAYIRAIRSKITCFPWASLLWTSLVFSTSRIQD